MVEVKYRHSLMVAIGVCCGGLCNTFLVQVALASAVVEGPSSIFESVKIPDDIAAA